MRYVKCSYLQISIDLVRVLRIFLKILAQPPVVPGHCAIENSSKLKLLCSSLCERFSLTYANKSKYPSITDILLVIA